MKKYLVIIFLFILLFANLASAAKFNLKQRNQKAETTKYLPKIYGYTQIKLSAGGGQTLEAISFGDIYVGAEGRLEQGVSFKTEFNLAGLATSGAISLGEVYLDIPNLIGGGNVFRFGRFKIPFGESMFRDSDEKPDITDPFYKTACFFSDYDFGVQSFSRIKEGSYELAFINGEGIGGDSSKSKDFVGRYIMKGKGMELGISEYIGSIGSNSRNNFSTYLKSKQGSLIGLFEYVNGTDMTGTNRTLDIYNVIVQKISPKLESVFIYESFDPNLDVSGDHILVYSFGMNLFKTKDVRFSSHARLQKVETASDYTKSVKSMVQVRF
ncbi:MAG: hypothetical protein HQ564_09970 [Candidatus Saganbacteria bacterium]|nr:hypothetical protein [Candidatus Saganbacteria bacterium]